MDDSDLYLVRVWRAGPQFRATARRVEDDATQLFAAPDQLIHFLSRPAVQAALPLPQAPADTITNTGATTCTHN